MGRIWQQQLPTTLFVHKNAQNGQSSFAYVGSYAFQDKDVQLNGLTQSQFDRRKMQQ